MGPAETVGGDWWLVHTLPRQEKALAADLDKLRIAYFLPLVRTRRRYGQRVRQIELPLFPSYLFMCGGGQERYAALMTHRAVAVLPVGDQERFKRELLDMRRVMSGLDTVKVYRGLQRGQRFRVRSGSLMGVEGVVRRERRTCQLFVGIEILQQSAVLEIEPQLLEPIE